MKRLLLSFSLQLLAFSLLFTGCARFSTVQNETRHYENGLPSSTEITTRAASSTFFASKSSLAKWKATQSEKSQGAEVGGLKQESDATASVNALVELVKLLKP